MVDPGCWREGGQDRGPGLGDDQRVRLPRARLVLPEEAVTLEAGVPFATLRVENPDVGRTTRRAVPAATDGHRRPLPDDVPTEADPGPPAELQPEAGGFRDGAGQAGIQAGWLDDHEEDVRPPGQGSQPAEPLGDPRGPGPGGRG